MLEEEKEANKIIASLKKALEGVNDTEWFSDNLGNVRSEDGSLVVCVAKLPYELAPSLGEAEYIALANPWNILKLIDHIHELEHKILELTTKKKGGGKS